MPTPCVYLTSVSNALGGVMISASHNPPEDNGIKILDAKLPQLVQSEIEAGLRGKATFPVSQSAWGRYYFQPELVGLRRVAEKTAHAQSILRECELF